MLEVKNSYLYQQMQIQHSCIFALKHVMVSETVTILSSFEVFAEVSRLFWYYFVRNCRNSRRFLVNFVNETVKFHAEVHDSFKNHGVLQTKVHFALHFPNFS